MSRKLLKKLIFCVFFAVFLVSCGDPSDENKNKDDETTEQVDDKKENAESDEKDSDSGETYDQKTDDETTDEDDESDPVLEIDYLPTSDNVKFLGRTTIIDDKLVMAYSSCGAEFYVKAKLLKVTLTGDDYVSADDGKNCARAIVLVNGERVLDEMILEKEKEYTIFQKDSSYEATVRIIKVTDASLPMAGIKKITVDRSGSICPSHKKDLKIEFIGDSITCAFGVDGNRYDDNSYADVEDSTKSYACMTAENLDADYSLVSIPGWGVISGATSETDNYAKVSTNLIPLYYSKLSYSYWRTFGGKQPQEIDWDFSQYVPDVVVINLGTNDSSYTRGDSAKIQEFVDGYKAFLTDIRSKNPDAYILCILGTLGDYLYDAVEQAATEYSAAASDSKVAALKLPQQIESDGMGSLLHPSEITQRKTAEILTEEIKSIILK